MLRDAPKTHLKSVPCAPYIWNVNLQKHKKGARGAPYLA
jgi:hypothetical protein